MPEYLPLFLPGVSLTRTASAAIVGGQLVRVSGSGTVAPTIAATSPAPYVADYLGVAGHDASAGDFVLVFRGGVQRLTAAGTITARQNVEASTGGTVVAHTNGTNDVNIVGIALTDATAGGLVEVKMAR